MGKARSVFTNNNIIHRSRESTKNAAIERRFGNGAKPAQPTVTKANTTRYDNNKGTILPLGDIIHNIGSPSKRFNQVYTSQIGLDNDIKIVISSGSGITYNTGSGGTDFHFFDVNGTTVMAVQNDRVDIRQDIINSSVTARDIGTSSGPWNDLYIKKIIIDDDDDSDISAATDDTILIKTGGSTRLTIKNDTIEATNPLVFTTVDPLSGSDHGICQNANGTQINTATGDLIVFSVNNAVRLSMANAAWGGQSGDDFRLFCVSSGNKAPINIEGTAGDPSTTENGDIWYDTNTGKFRVKEGGTAKDMI